jgi:hypothetical protein
MRRLIDTMAKGPSPLLVGPTPPQFAGVLTKPERLRCCVESSLEIAHQAFQAFSPASRWREVVGDHTGVAEIQQHGGLLRREAKQVLVVVVDDLHQAWKQHMSVVGRRRPR